MYVENPTLGVGGSEALKAMGLDKKTPFDVKRVCGLAPANEHQKEDKQHE